MIDYTLDVDCGGAIISPRLVLSSFHCAAEYDVHDEAMDSSEEHDPDEDFRQFGDQNYNISDNRLCAYLGAHNTNQSFVRRNIIDSKFPPKPRFDWAADRDDEHDFVMFVLDKPVTFDSKIRPICLPHTLRDIDNKRLTVAGWGLTEDSTKDGSEILKKVDLICCAGFNELNNTLEIMVEKKDGVVQVSCAGDSGTMFSLATISSTFYQVDHYSTKRKTSLY